MRAGTYTEMYYTIVLLLALSGTAIGRLSKHRALKLPSGSLKDDPNIEGFCSTLYSAGSPNDVKEKINPCHYYRCQSGNYIRNRCPDGMGLSPIFVKKWLKLKKGSNGNPCTKPNKKCKITLKERGLNDYVTTVCGVDVMIIIDVSCSIEEVDQMKVKQFVNRMVKVFPIKPGFTQVGGLVFSKNIEHVAYLNEFDMRRKVLERFANYPITMKPCGTSTFAALEMARTVYFTEQNGRRPNKKGVLLVITDGFTNPIRRQNETLHQAAMFDAEMPEVQRTVIGVPNIKQEEKGNRGIDGVAEWSKIASSPNDVLTLDSFDALYDIIDDITRKSCETL
ncbi:unnamed protein product [Owenia fusiformis]|uniref:VWFA domain-containing protein n=1 Tax=Owenia fusiformis TaxID=6347 RepID=A0A8S4PU75_OWEFU|nr:unnamed protein product [Owenia fusiformis]